MSKGHFNYNFNQLIDLKDSTYPQSCNTLIVNPFPDKPWFFTSLQYKSFENTAGKGEIARNEQFLLFPQCFLYLFGELTAIFNKLEIVVCKLFQFRRV